jgi:hypothetical protein
MCSSSCAAQLATLPLQARQLLGKLGEELEPRFIELIHQENPALPVRP